jgi:hypothetical protein
MLVTAGRPGHNFGAICRMVGGAPNLYPDIYPDIPDRTRVISL